MSNFPHAIRSSKTISKTVRSIAVLAMLLAMVAPLGVSRAFAAQIFSAQFIRGVAYQNPNNQQWYARPSGPLLQVQVNTDTSTNCLQTVPASLPGGIISFPGTRQWTLYFNVSGSNGSQNTIVLTPWASGSGPNCAGGTGPGPSAALSYFVDSAGPNLTHSIVPAPNGNGWNNSNVTVTWPGSPTPTQTGSETGLPINPNPTQASVTTEGANNTVQSSAFDPLGNQTTDKVTIKLDKTAPTVTGSRAPVADANGWNNKDVTVSFNCSDGLSGIDPSGGCTAPVTLSTDGQNQSVPGTARDLAGNTATAMVGSINIDKTPPTLSGAPTSSPNGAGWYNGSVTVHWTCSDATPGSGIAGDGSCPADSTISGEGNGLTALASVSDVAGNTTGAASDPAVNIDMTPPNTTANVPSPDAWNNTAVTVQLIASDNLSRVAATDYVLDGGTQQTGSSVTISADGIHTLEFWSVDNAGNTEVHKTAQVKIDQTPPTINHSLSPPANALGWNHTGVTITFQCTDALSGIASCVADGTNPPSASRFLSSEGKNLPAPGTATDNANNTVTDPATVSIDMTPPSIIAFPDRPANGHNWYNADVQVTFQCNDGLSGIASCPAPVTVGQGVGQSVSRTATDAAGNSAPGDLGGINVDETPPSLNGAPTTPANSYNWYNGDVSVHWTATDALSGLDGPAPDDTTLTGEGSSVPASASVSDLAGNGTTTTISVSIDRHPPSTLATVPPPLGSGWYAGAIPITLSASDSLSGVDATYYNVDGGAAQQYAGAITDNLAGTHVFGFWSVDRAGNSEAPQTMTLSIDNIPPTISGSRTPAANANGWNNTDVTVSFSCSDLESGIASCTSPVTLSNEGANQSVAGVATDNAGNSVSVTVGGINIDKTTPTLVASLSPANPAANGWYNSSTGAPTVSFTCNDTGGSGLAGACPAAYTFLDGANQSVSRTISDLAGNSAATTSSTVNVDVNGPTITSAGLPAGVSGYPAYYYLLNSIVAAPNPSCTDSVSGVASCTATSINTSSVGANTITVAATDTAGNTNSQQFTYHVIYRWDGFLQPINDTAHQCQGCSMSIFKAGSTVPAKFQLKDANGNVVQAAGSPMWSNPQQYSTTSAPVDESTYTYTPDGGNYYRWDTTAQQYIYNWGTPRSPGTLWHVYVTLDDGQTYYVNIGLK